jgi:hypothetical protein
MQLNIDHFLMHQFYYVKIIFAKKYIILLFNFIIVDKELIINTFLIFILLIYFNILKIFDLFLNIFIVYILITVYEYFTEDSHDNL